VNNALMEMWEMALDYSGEMQCSIEDAIYDLEFDGPNGSYGPTKEERDALLAMAAKDKAREMNS
jgi:hypothetical protein